MEIILDHYLLKMLQQINKALKKFLLGFWTNFSSLYIQYGLEAKSKHSERTKLQDKDDLPGSVHKNRSLGHFDCFPPINKSWKKKRNFYAKWKLSTWLDPTFAKNYWRRVVWIIYEKLFRRRHESKSSLSISLQERNMWHSSSRESGNETSWSKRSVLVCH